MQGRVGVVKVRQGIGWDRVVVGKSMVRVE